AGRYGSTGPPPARGLAEDLRRPPQLAFDALRHVGPPGFEGVGGGEELEAASGREAVAADEAVVVGPGSGDDEVLRVGHNCTSISSPCCSGSGSRMPGSILSGVTM